MERTRQEKRKTEQFHRRTKKVKPSHTMDLLSDNLLKKVLSYVPSRRYAAQVNQQFYRVVCLLDEEQDIYKLKLDGADEVVSNLKILLGFYTYYYVDIIAV